MAAGSTYTPIYTTTVSGSVTQSVTFNSIPSTYTDLVLVINLLGFYASPTYLNGALTFNGDNSTNYSYTIIKGDGSSATSTRSSGNTRIANLLIPALSTDNGTRGNIIINIQNYKNTTTYKTLLARVNIASDITQALVGLWSKTPEAINSLTFTNLDATQIYAGSTFTLYGILAA